MRLFVLLTAACLCAELTFAQAEKQSTGSSQRADSGADNKKPTKAAPFRLQLEMRVAFEPTAFPSGPRLYLMYELDLTNYLPMPLSLARIEVLDGDALDAQPIAGFEAEQLESMLQPLGRRNLADRKERLVIAE